MRLNIASKKYRVGEVEAPLEDASGRIVFVNVEQAKRLISVSSDTPADFRSAAVIQGGIMAWRLELPSILMDDAEQARIAEQLMEDIQGQGGLAALRLGAAAGQGFDVSRITGSLAGAAADRMFTCEVCGARISPHNVKVSPARVDPASKLTVVDLAFWCEGCIHLATWTEQASPGGFPMGICVGTPRYIKGPEAHEWCRLHTEETGVIMLS